MGTEMKVNSMGTFNELPQYDFIEELSEGDSDMNLRDVVVLLEDVNTEQMYEAEGYFEHGIDEYYIDEKTIKLK